MNLNLVDQFEIGLRILNHFVFNVEKEFLENEIPSICLLVVPLVKRLPKETEQSLIKLLSLHNYRISIYYQLCFVPTELESLKLVIDFINKRIEEFIDFCYRIRSCSQETRESINHKIDIDARSKIDPKKLILLLSTVEFSVECQKIYFLLENLMQMSDKLQEMILRQLNHCLNENKYLFYQIYLLRKLEFYDDYSLIENLKIDLIIDINNPPNNPVIKSIRLISFFRFILLRLFECIKFSSSHEVTKLCTSCLGILGATDMRFFKMDRPFLKEDFNNIDNHSIDYSNHYLFYPKKKNFKLLVLEILMNMVKSSIRLTDYNCASFALQEILPFFATNIDNYSGLFSTIFSNDITKHREIKEGENSISTQQIERYVKNQYCRKTSMNSTSQEMEQLNKCDQIKTFLQNEVNESINLEKDLKGELKFYREVLDISLFNLKEFKKRDTIDMRSFFNSIDPVMSYNNFLQGFIYMLYHSFIIPHINTNETSGDLCSTFGNLDPEEFISQSINANFSQKSSNVYIKEFQEIKAKIKRLGTPEKIFIVCYHVIFRNIKLSYVLLPFLLLLSLGYGTDQMREEFATLYSEMIKKKFLQQRIIFFHEIGQMASELFCYIHDYLKRWQQSRRLAHQVILHNRFLREKTIHSIDKEFHAIKLILDSIDPLDMVRLSYESRSYSKALLYLEQLFNERRTIMEKKDFINLHFDTFLKIYHGLADTESIHGLTKQRDFFTLNQFFHQHLADQDSIGQLICGSKLLIDKNIDKLEYLDLQEKYFQTLIDHGQQLPNVFFQDAESNQILSHYLLESTWKLNCWDFRNPFISSFDLFEANNSENESNFPWNCPYTSSHFPPSFGHIIFSMKKRQSPFILDNKLCETRQSFMAPFYSALLSNCFTAYSRSFETTLIPIHIMQDMNQFVSTIYGFILAKNGNGQIDSPTDSQIQIHLKNLIKEWQLRNKIIPDGDIRLQVLEIQRSLMNLLESQKSLDFSDELFRFWHESLKSSMTSGNLDRAYIYLLEALKLKKQLDNRSSSSSINPLTESEQIEFVLDHSEIFWARKNFTASIDLLQSELSKRYIDLRNFCYLETLKSLAQMPEQDLFHITNSLNFNLSKSQLKQLSSNLISELGSNEDKVDKDRSASSNSVNLLDSGFSIDSLDEQTIENYSKLQLRFAQYCESSGYLNSYALMVLYKSVSVSNPKWEEGHFQLAMFYRRLYKEYQNSGLMLDSKTAYNIGKPNEILDLKGRVIKSLCESLKFGSYKYARISLPILFDIWIDLGNKCLMYQQKCNPNDQNRTMLLMKDLIKKVAERSTLIIKQMLSTVNNALFLVDLDTLIGHILHHFEPISKLIEEIIVGLIVDFPEIMTWQILRSLNAKGRRSLKSQELIKLASKQNISNGINIDEYFNAFRQFSICLRDLAQFKPQRKKTLNQFDSKYELLLKNVAPNLVRLLQTEHQFVFPCNKYFMPNATNLKRFSEKNHFGHCLFIEKLDDCVQIMKSLQMPKKLAIFCNDGIKRTILVKCGDDLRKDRAMLNFCNTFNQCYREEIKIREIEPMSKIEPRFDAAIEKKIWSRRKQDPLKIQTYFVVPLSDSHGVIEWIPGLFALKTLVEGEYTKTRAQAKRYLNAKTSFIKSVMMNNITREKRIEFFMKSYSFFQPPVLQNWFYENYADSHSWYLARRNFTRTSATISVLGYILGLCDRHAENILVDPSTGQVVHVDFNCLFNRGEEFMVPECVPFRLTQNMLSAMGVLGCDGPFRSTCEDVLLVLRQFREIFSQPITVFLYDTLSDWSNPSDRTEIVILFILIEILADETFFNFRLKNLFSM